MKTQTLFLYVFVCIFVAEIIVCQKHFISLSHSVSHGSRSHLVIHDNAIVNDIEKRTQSTDEITEDILSVDGNQHSTIDSLKDSSLTVKPTRSNSLSYTTSIKPTVESTVSDRSILDGIPKQHYQLVLFTTEDSSANQKELNVLYMLRLFQQKFSFRGIVFTSNNDTIALCESLGISTVQDVKRNPYGLPFIGDMYTRAYDRFDASFYGYINADILVSSSVFDVLSFVETQRPIRLRGSFIELCHNAYVVKTPSFSSTLTQDDYDGKVESALKHPISQRGISSVDIFILSREFHDFPFGPFVIGRSRIDTYMLLYCINNKGVVVDLGLASPTLHQGQSSYTSRAKQTVETDYNWNMNRLKSFASLSVAQDVISQQSNGQLELRHKLNIKMVKTRKK